MKFRDLNRQYQALKPLISQAVQGVLEQGDFIQGQTVRQLEEQLAACVRRKHCITCASGTDGLLLSLLVLDIGPGDAVFTPDFTYIAAANVICLTGAQPVFVDIDPVTFNMDPRDLEDRIEAVLKAGRLRPKAVMPANLFGLPADYDSLQPLAAKYGLSVIEDAAQSFGASIGQRRSGSFGTLSVTSFFPAKPLGCYGDGGAVFTDSDRLADRLRSLCQQGQIPGNKYICREVGCNSRLDTIQSAILLVKLQAYDREQAAVERVASIYGMWLRPHVQVPDVPRGMTSAWAQYTVLFRDSRQRNQVKEALRQAGIPSMVYYPLPMHQQPSFCSTRFEKKHFLHTDYVTERCLSLPIHPYMRQEETELVCTVILEALALSEKEASL